MSQQIYQKLNFTLPEVRRAPLLLEMSRLNEAAISCHSCRGLCCTFEANSMKLTPLEALDLYLGFKEIESKELWATLDECIKKYRLDQDLMTGKGKSFRRTYTCPLFMHQSFGCPLPIWSKPYGCLAFNPTKENVKEGEGCTSSIQLLEEVENRLSQEEAARAKALFFFEKKTIPEALLFMRLAMAKISL